jgi:hypothetical protein
MIIANRLTDGIVVFFVAAGRWTTAIAEGLVVSDSGDADVAIDAAKRDEVGCLVVDPQLIEVEDAGDGPRPTAIREAIRAFGPTV